MSGGGVHVDLARVARSGISRRPRQVAALKGDAVFIRGRRMAKDLGASRLAHDGAIYGRRTLGERDIHRAPRGLSGHLAPRVLLLLRR